MTKGRLSYLLMAGRYTFSSNNLSGIGGFDIFKTFYVDKTMSWETPTNIGMPINSPGDDLFFKLGNDGQKAVFVLTENPVPAWIWSFYTGLFTVRKEQHLRCQPLRHFFKYPLFGWIPKEYQDEVLASKIYSVTIEPFYYDQWKYCQSKKQATTWTIGWIDEEIPDFKYQ